MHARQMLSNFENIIDVYKIVSLFYKTKRNSTLTTKNECDAVRLSTFTVQVQNCILITLPSRENTQMTAFDASSSRPTSS